MCHFISQLLLAILAMDPVKCLINNPLVQSFAYQMTHGRLKAECID